MSEHEQTATGFEPRLALVRMRGSKEEYTYQVVRVGTEEQVDSLNADGHSDPLSRFPCIERFETNVTLLSELRRHLQDCYLSRVKLTTLGMYNAWAVAKYQVLGNLELEQYESSGKVMDYFNLASHFTRAFKGQAEDLLSYIDKLTAERDTDIFSSLAKSWPKEELCPHPGIPAMLLAGLWDDQDFMKLSDVAMNALGETIRLIKMLDLPVTTPKAGMETLSKIRRGAEKMIERSRSDTMDDPDNFAAWLCSVAGWTESGVSRSRTRDTVGRAHRLRTTEGSRADLLDACLRYFSFHKEAGKGQESDRLLRSLASIGEDDDGRLVETFAIFERDRVRDGDHEESTGPQDTDMQEV